MANIVGKVWFKNFKYHASRLRLVFFFFRFLNGPFRCLAQGCCFKQIDLVDLKYMRKLQILTFGILSLVLKILRRKSIKFTNAFTNVLGKNNDNYKWPLQLCIKIIPCYKNANTLYFVHKFQLVIMLAKLL